jgi:phosphoribosylaminoimidazolecarboxamide formyltransferase / IMP cyclohydrolase
MAQIKRALISVSDKQGVVEFARGLSRARHRAVVHRRHRETAAHAGLRVRDVSEVTGFPEIMDGRIKTLHPRVHGGLLARRGIDDAVMAAHGIEPDRPAGRQPLPVSRDRRRPGMHRR